MPRSCYPTGHPVHVTICSVRRTRPFIGHRLASAIIDLVEKEPNTFAACLMPDHLHWILDDAAAMSRTAQAFKSRSTRLAWQLGWTGRLWQRSFYDHVIRRTEGLRRVALYTVCNPVRAGFVDDWRDYPYCVARWR